jgi:hypothetical protein
MFRNFICACFFVQILCLDLTLFAQVREQIRMSQIATVQLYGYGDQQSFPLMTLNGNDRLQLNFDDLEGNVKSYYYTYVLCDYNWKPVNLSPFDYIKGFTQIRISNYRVSSIALTRYTHYQAILPDKDCLPTRSGNYLLKVYLDGDTNKLAFVKQLVVMNPQCAILGEVVQPFTPDKFKTHQKIRFSVALKGINSFSAAQQVKVVVLQNNRWDIAQRDIAPTFVRGNSLEYNADQIAVFAAGKEWRWADLRNFRLQSDRVEKAIYGKRSTEVFMKPDRDRTGDRYIFFPDLDGTYRITTFESINPFWQGDYATVNFYFKPESGQPFSRDLYLSGQFTGFQKTDSWRMKFDESTGLYTCAAYLKQGYYNYSYLFDPAECGTACPDLEGNYWETENMYTILVYYKSFTDRCDQLIGAATINSRNDRPGMSF